MSIDDAELVRDFLTESYENLDRLDRELVALEKDPQNRDALAGVFRTIHTIKGTCGFLGFGKLEKVAHIGENLLSLLRDGKILLNPELTTVLLAMVDAVRQMLGEIQNTGQEGNADNTQLIANLTRLHASGANGVPASQKPTQPGAQVPLMAAPPPTRTVEKITEPAPKIECSAPAKPESAHQNDLLKPDPSSAPAANASASSSPASASSSPTQVNETIRVGVNLLDNLMTLVGELVLARNQLVQFANRVDDSGLQAVSQRMNLIATELQGEVMKTRMQPIGNVWSQFPRTVRDVAMSCGKEVNIEMEGKETELDKTIIESIKDPLTHLVRNSVDHGIELPDVRVKASKPRAGRLTLRAFHEGGQVNIEISDDGAGLNRERIRQKAVERGLMNAEQTGRLTDREIFHLIFMSNPSPEKEPLSASRYLSRWPSSRAHRYLRRRPLRDSSGQLARVGASRSRAGSLRYRTRLWSAGLPVARQASASGVSAP